MEKNNWQQKTIRNDLKTQQKERRKGDGEL